MFRKYERILFLLILVLTVWLVWGFSLTKTNFSVIANKDGRRMLLWCWGAFVGNFCYLYMDRLMQMADCRDWLVRSFSLASLFLLVAGVGIPYLPKVLPRLARLHVGISFLSPVCFGISQSRFLYLMQRKLGRIWRIHWCLQILLGTVSVGLLLGLGMVTSLLEIVLTVGFCLYLWSLHGKLEKCSGEERNTS